MKKMNDLIGEQAKDFISDKDKKKFSRKILDASAALVCLVVGFVYTKFFPDQDVITGLIYLIGVVIIGAPLLATAIKGFLKKDPNATMEILVSVAMIMAALDNEYVIAILVPVILTLVHFLEEKSIMGGRDAIEGLKKMQSNTAILLENGVEREVNAKELRCGNTIIIKPGMSLPIDGTIVEGTTSMDQKSLTGESLPKSVTVGDKVFAGTTNIDGRILVVVDKEYKDTSFQKIVDILEKAEGITIPETRLVDQFMMYYIPIVLVIATLVWLFTKDITKAIAILVVSCPCGHMLISSAPMIASLAASTKRGILIKNSTFIEKLANVDYIVFDKTGTITNATLELIDTHLVHAKTREELIANAASLAKHSLHPVSKSIVSACSNIDYELGFEITEHIGNGLSGKKGDTEIILGNYRWITSMGYDVTDAFEQDGATSWIIRNGLVLGCIIFKDIPREDAAETIQNLKKMGIQETCLLTGDNRIAAERIKQAVNIDTMYCSLLPEQKLSKVSEAKKEHTVAVVGDGINDALALMEADVGIAMGAMGSDTAIQSADISLMNNSLDNIPYVILLSRKTKDIIYQNIVIAFLISFGMIFLAATGIVTALTGAFLHNIGAFIILINSGRI